MPTIGGGSRKLTTPSTSHLSLIDRLYSLELSNITQEIIGLEALEYQMSRNVERLRHHYNELQFSKTLSGRVFSWGGRLFAIYCVYRIIVVSIPSAMRRVKLTCACSCVNSGRFQLDSSHSLPLQGSSGRCRRHFNNKLRFPNGHLGIFGLIPPIRPSQYRRNSCYLSSDQPGSCRCDYPEQH